MKEEKKSENPEGQGNEVTLSAETSKVYSHSHQAKNQDAKTAYRPLCVINSLVKRLEHLIVAGLNQEMLEKV